VNRLIKGTAVLARRYRIWLWDDGLKAALQRGTGTLAAAGFLGGISLAAPVVLLPVTAVCLLAAWGAGRPDDEEITEAEPEEDGEEFDFLAALYDLMADADRLHLAQIAEELYGDPAATATVREECAAAGVPITRGVRVPGRAVSTGVHRRDLPPLPDHSPTDPVAVVCAGQSEQQQQQHHGREGFIVLPDPDGNPHRHEIRWINQPTRHAS
jgi:hypothetical protein